MQREIDGRLYDTAQATVVASNERTGTHIHRARTLYRSTDGAYFVVEEHEIYGVDGALMTALSDAMARQWLEEHGKADLAQSLFEDHDTPMTLTIGGALRQRVGLSARAAGMSENVWALSVLEAAAESALGAQKTAVQPEDEGP